MKKNKVEATRMKNSAPVKLVVGKSETCPCNTFPKGTIWDEEKWKQHWADQKRGHQKRLEELRLESHGIKRR